jgi:uncharacterized protein YlxW (UPF0749 family)
MTGGRPFPTQALVDLVLDPRDPAYREAAARRGGAPRHRSGDRWLTALGCLVIGFALAVAWVHAHRGAPQAAKVHDRLVQRVRAAASTADGLNRTAAALETRLSALRARALAGNGALRQRLQEDQLAAGEVPVTGPGLEVSLGEPAVTATPSAVPTALSRPTTIATILTDRDVRSVVNQLWSDGAEAIAVNGIRLTPLSAIRFAGQAVLVDREPIASPYVIDAVGAAAALDTGFAASDVASRYQTLQAAEGISFSFTEKPSLALPAAAPAPLRYASAGSGR